MSQQKVDADNIDSWVNFFINLFDKGEWKLLIVTLLLTYAVTYVVKIIYYMFIKDVYQHPNHIRLLAMASGMIAAFMLWHDHHMDMHWYSAGLVVGFLSIVVHHVLNGVVNMQVVKDKAPFLAKLLKGTTK